jgi:hypothetical protein
MKIFLCFVFVILVELLILAFLPRQHLVDVIHTERQYSLKWFGEEKSLEMINSANGVFNGMFVDTGLVEGSNNFFLKHRNKKHGKGFQKMSDSKFWDHLVSGVDKMWLIIESGMLRLQIMWVCLLLSLSFVIPSLLDGVVKREIRKYGEDNSSINVYSVAMLVLTSTFSLPLVLLFWPMAISPPYMAIWTIILAFSIWLLSSNVQLKV